MNEKKIMHIIKSQGWFEVSWRWRDQSIRKKLWKMAQDKKIIKVNLGQGGRFIYEDPEKKAWTKFHDKINGTNND